MANINDSEKIYADKYDFEDVFFFYCDTANQTCQDNYNCSAEFVQPDN